MDNDDPRRLIARLAVAVMVSDGRITPSEVDALGRLDELGLGPLSDLAEEEIRGAVSRPIDLRATCDGLARATPQAAAVILSVLAEIAASDRAVSPAELATLRSVADLLGLGAADTAHIVSAAMAEYGASLDEEPAAPSEVQPRPMRRETVPVAHQPDEGVDCTPTAQQAELQRAYSVLGIDAATTRARLDAAYLALVERYDPAKVADLGADFVALAVRKLAEVTAAFETAVDARFATG